MRLAALLAVAMLSAPAMAQEIDGRMDHGAHGDHGAQGGQAMPDMPAMEDEAGGDPHQGHEAHGAHSPPAAALPALPLPVPDHSAHRAPQILPAAPDLPGDALPPPIPEDHAADRYFPQERMERARAALRGEGRFATASVMIDELEYRPRGGKDGYAWDGRFWYGGDIDRLALSTEGEGRFGAAPESAELRAVWRHALDPWFNLELGVRHDFRPDPERSYAVIGIEGLAPYWFEVSGHVFVSDKGDVHLRAEAEYDQRITQRLIFQPRAEIDAALQDVPELGIGAGFESVELGARLRYEFARQFAPYAGIHWERRLGETARLARARGEGASSLAAVVGIRAWF